MAVLSATFKAIDDMSSVMDRIADSGSAAISQWENAGTAICDAFDQATASTGEAAQVIDSAAGSVEELSVSLDAQTQAAEDAAKALDQVGEGAEGAEQHSEKFGTASVNAVNALGQALAAAGIVKMIHEIGDEFMEAADIAMAFETSIAKVSTLADTSEMSMGEISSSIRALSNEMGVSANQIAEATYQAISGSVDTAVAVDFVAQATMLAKGGFTEATTAVDVLTTAVNAYGLSIDEVEQVSSMLVTTQNLGKTSVGELASNMGKVIPIAAAYGVEMDNLSTAYAVLTKGGIETANATTYMRGMLQELGSTSSTVSKILMDETEQSFAELIASGNSLADVLDILGNTVDGDTTAFANLWQSQTAGLGALSLFNSGSEEFNTTLLAMQDSSGAVSNAFETMAGTTETSRDRMNTAQENMAASFGNILTPALDVVYEAGAKVFTWVGDVLDQHPAVAAAVAGVATGLGVLAVGIGAVTTALAIKTAVTTIATAATAVFGVTLSAAIWPITLIVAGVAALVAGIAVLVNWIGKQNEEYNSLSATSKQHYNQLEQLNAEYDEAIALYGENSEAARRLSADIAGLEAVYESTRFTLEDFIAENDKLVESHDKLVGSFQSGLDEINQEGKYATALIDKLEELSSKTELTAAEQEQMSAIVVKLNEQMPDLALTFDQVTGSIGQSADAIRQLAEAQAAEQRIAANHAAYVGLLADQAELEEQITKAQQEREAAEALYDQAGWWSQTFGQAKKDVEALTEEEDRLQRALDETNHLIAENERAFEDAARAAEEAARIEIGMEEAIGRAVRAVADDLNDLVAAYDESYEAARSSIDSTIGLFDQMATACEISTQDMLKSFQSQVDYLETYTENLRKAAEYGLDEGLIASLNDGSEESAGYINAIINEIERLGGATEGMSEGAAAFVDDFNSSFQEVETAKDEFASTVAEMETDFSNSLDEIESRMVDAIDNMTMETEAADAAKDTIQAYIDTIKSMTGEAHSAAKGVALAAADALGGAGVSTAGLPGYATGTLSAAPGYALVGEDGPEIIKFGGGEVVYPADDTQQILSSAGGASLYVPPPANLEVYGKENGGKHGLQEKRVALDINASGAIHVDGNADKNSVVEIMLEHIRPILMNVLQQDVFEEGDMSYDF